MNMNIKINIYKGRFSPFWLVFVFPAAPHGPVWLPIFDFVLSVYMQVVFVDTLVD